MGATGQLAALAGVHGLLVRAGVDYWLFGGWAVDFHVGAVTRAHDDVDIAVWLDDAPRIGELLAGDGWRHAPEPGEDGGTGYEREGVRLELTYLVRGADGGIATPLRSSEARWPDGAFGDEAGELQGTVARLLGLDALREGKSRPREAPGDAAKDRADAARLPRRG